jgi:hypothetical protein
VEHRLRSRLCCPTHQLRSSPPMTQAAMRCERRTSPMLRLSPLLLVLLLSCSADALTQVTIDNTMPRLDVNGMIMDAHDHQIRWALMATCCSRCIAQSSCNHKPSFERTAMLMPTRKSASAKTIVPCLASSTVQHSAAPTRAPFARALLQLSCCWGEHTFFCCALS